MKAFDNIPTEIIQRLTSSQAWEYSLVPCSFGGDVLECCGDESKDYDGAVQEMDVIYGIKIKVDTIPSAQFHKLLKKHYRNEAPAGKSQTRQITEISSGQGFLMGLIEEAFDSHASDIHIETYEKKSRIRFRLDGKLIERYVIEKINYSSLINQIKILANLDISEKRLPQDGRILFNFNEKKFDVRVSSLPTIYGEKVVMRLLTRHVELLDLQNLGFSPQQLSDYENAIRKPFGLILICGPTGSGKSTTLYATLRQLNNDTDNILTIEDPIEYTLDGVNQVQLKEEIGMTFQSALRTFLRQDPDIIMLGEIRDADTARMAIRSSLTGHLILSTIHTNSAWGSIARLNDMGVHPSLIADTMIMCAAQRLVRLLCPHCKQKEKTTKEIKQLFGGGEPIHHYTAVGCEKCYYTGYKGRRAIYEVIPMSGEMVMAARNNESDVETLLQSKGIVSLRSAALAMLARGDTAYSEIIPLLDIN